MGRTDPPDAPGTPLPTTARLEGIFSRGADEAAPIVLAALDDAARGGAGDEAGLETDRAVLAALRRSGDRDAILTELPVAALASLAERAAARTVGGSPDARDRRALGWDVLDLLRRSSVLRRIPESGHAEWAGRLLALVDATDLTPGRLFRLRAAAYGSKPLFRLSSASGIRTLSWRQAAARVEAIARGLLSLSEGSGPGRTALLSENRLELALCDLACLGSGIVNVLVPANSTSTDVGFILRHAQAETVIVSGAEQLRKVLPHRGSLPALRNVVVFDPQAALVGGRWPTLDALAAADAVSADEPERRLDAVRADDLATIMYTSGTTGHPKGIRFSHRNLVFKRFARALALPEIGENDVFLAYLPLFHTFGRFLELQGCVFWGATYCFLDHPSVESLLRGMEQHAPTVFISVPLKWIQLHETIARAADPESASDRELQDATRRATGGRLRWGLSAAGHLAPETFRFFQRQGIELMSGFGMTEATGGITMTPPGRYRDDSLGKALPGIELRLADDGELLIRGPYVTIGYLDPPAGETTFDADGWLHTGDIMERDDDGFLRLVDRKKEIYKNVKGETIAPQRIENLFREMESVGRVFVVGDHREYNTALIWPNPAYLATHLVGRSPSEIKAHFRSLVVSVNSFLAPFERIVDFAVVERELDPARGELTPKQTPRRKVVERSFADVIRLLYRRTDLRVGGAVVTFPNWLFQALGLTSEDLAVGDDRITLPATGTTLVVRRSARGLTRVGSFVYRHPPGPLSLGVLLNTPRLWIGNEELVGFAPIDPAARERPGRAGEGIECERRLPPPEGSAPGLEEMRALAERADVDLLDLHRAAIALLSREEPVAREALRVLERALARDDGALAEPARVVLARAAESESLEVRRLAFRILVPAEREGRRRATLRRFLEGPGTLLDRATRAALCELSLSDGVLDAFLAAALDVGLGPDRRRSAQQRAASLLRFLAEYGATHPTRYRRLRAFLVRTMATSDTPAVRAEAARAVTALRDGFREWLGGPVRIAVDPESGQEYRWSDVVVFDEGIDATARRRLLSAIQGTSFLREALFLFSGGLHVRLSDIPPAGVWVRHLGTRHGKAVYRITVQTRFQGAHDLAANLNLELGPAEVQEEIQGLILCGESAGRDPLVEDFGGYWPEHDLWSEEFVAGDTLERAALRLSRRSTEPERFRQAWPFLVWSALAAYVDFWDRTGRRQEIADPGMGNVIVPTHDYHTGARIVSVSARRPHAGLVRMLRAFREELVLPGEERWPEVAGLAGWSVAFSALLEVVGETEGLRLLRETLWQDRDPLPADLRAELERYVASVEERGFLPMRLHFAAQRYLRWEELSGDATPQARARTLQELYDTYALQRLASTYPEARARLFRETVLRRAQGTLARGLDDMIGRLRRREMQIDETIDAVSALRAEVALDPGEDYFLARLSYPHLRPEDAAAFVRAEVAGHRQSEMVVSLQDLEGNTFGVRHALNPKEVGQLYRLFLASKLDVRFRPEHQYLLAIHDRGPIIAGLHYEIDAGEASAHLEKIAVAERWRKKGIADALLREFFHRLRAAGIRTVTTGFFRPEFFYGHGFVIEKRHAGLVKTLEPAATS